MRRLLTLILLTIGCVVVPSVVAPLTATAATTSSSVVLVGQPNNDLIPSTSRTWRDGAGTISVSDYFGTLNVGASGGPSGDWVSFSFQPVSGESLVPGTYEHVVEDAGYDEPRLSMYGPGSCSHATSRFTIHELAPDFSTVWITFEHHCAGEPSAVFGEIRWRMPDAQPDLVVVPSRVDWPIRFPQAYTSDFPVTVVNSGAAPISITSAATGSADFPVVANGCSTLPVGASCVVTVRFVPQAGGDRTGTLTIAGSFGAGTHTVPLSGRGSSGYNSWRVRGEPGELVTQGREFAYGIGRPWGFDGDEHVIRGLVNDGFAGATDWELLIRAGEGDVLEAGRTYPATTYYETGPGGAGLRLEGPDFCDQVTGSFTIQELAFDAAGRVTSIRLSLNQRCTGSTRSAYASIAWNATSPPTLMPPVLDLRINRNEFDYGDRVPVDITISADSPVRTVALYKTEFGKKQVLVRNVTVDVSGHVTVPVKAVRRTTFTARLDPGGAFPNRSASDEVTVTARLTQKMLGSPTKRGTTYVYRINQRATLLATLKPKHTGDCLRFRAEFYYYESWDNPVVIDCVKLDKRSRAAAYIDGSPGLAGIPIRLRAEWHGNKENPKYIGEWVYLRFVR